MSVKRDDIRIRVGRRYYAVLKRPLCLLALLPALLSAISISVFCHMRSFADVQQYYTGEISGLFTRSFSALTLLLALGLYLFYVFALHALRRGHPACAVIALVIGFNITVALSMEHSGLRELFLPTGVLGNLAVLLGFAALAWACIELIHLRFDYRLSCMLRQEQTDRADETLLYFCAFGCILLLWLPILFCCYPGSVHNDTRYQIMGWLGLKPITASHPILTTVFYGVIYRLGMAIGGQEKAIFLCLLCQDVVVAAAMGLAALYVRRYTRSRGWFAVTIAFFGLLPVWQSAAQVLLKDVLHTGCFLLFACVYLDCLQKREKSWKNVILLFLTALLVAYTRKATFYLAVICIFAAALWHWRRFLLPYLAMLGVFVGLFWFSNNILYPYLGVGEEWETENYSMQFQQIALYCRTYQDEMSDEEKAIINSTLDFDTIVRDYTPMISDPVKSTYRYDGTDHAAFWQLYRTLLRRHPLLFVKAIIMDSFEHFNPWIEDISYNVYISREDDFLTVNYRSNLHSTLNKIWNDCLKIPGIRVLLGTGLYAWMLLLALGYGIRKKSWLAVLGLLPSLTLMIGLLMSHVNGNIRYGYPLIAAAPLNLGWVIFAASRKLPKGEIPDSARFSLKNLLGLIPAESVLQEKSAEAPAESAAAPQPAGTRQLHLGNRYTLDLDLTQCILAVPAALLSALSVSVFCFVRSMPSLAQYYSAPQPSRLLTDCLSPLTVLLALLFWLFFTAFLHMDRSSHPSGAVVGLLMGLNMLITLSMEHSDLRELFLPVGLPGNLAVLLGFTILCGTAAEIIFLLCERKRIHAAELEPTAFREDCRRFFLAFALILLCWIPGMLFCYPGSNVYDTIRQIRSWVGLEPINASHPLLCTILYGSLYQYGLSVGDESLGLFLCALAQALVNAVAMALVAVAGYRHTRVKAWYWGIIAFFGILPTWQNAAQLVMKDVLHTGCYLLFYLQFLRCLREEKPRLRNVLLLCLCALLLTYTRKATFYMAVICVAVLAVVHWRKALVPYLLCLAVVAGSFVYTNAVLYPRLNIVGERENENYSMQLQQVALYCRTYQKELTPEEIEIINSTLDYEKIIRDYTPMISDPVKGTYRGTEEDHAAFWALYRKLMLRHPEIFVRSLLMGSFEHLNPWYNDVKMRVYMYRGEDFIHAQYRNENYWDAAVYWMSWLKIPVLRLFIGTGLYMWLFMIAAGYTVRRKSKMGFLGLMPALVLFVGLFMSHVNGEERYGFPMVASAPVIFPWILYADHWHSKAEELPEKLRKKKRRFGRRQEETAQKAETIVWVERTPEEAPEAEHVEAELVTPEEEKDMPQPEAEAESADAAPQREKENPPRYGKVLDFVTRYIPIPLRPKTYLDVLKVLAIFLVLWNHTVSGFELYNRVLDMPQHMLYLCFSIFDKIAVPLFFMCSGALLLGREESWKKILTHRVRRFALILLVVSVINYIQYYSGRSTYSVQDFLARFYSGSIRTPLWYLYAYLAFLLTLPFLRKLARTMREQDYLWLVGLSIAAQLLTVADSLIFHGTNYHSSDFHFFIAVNYAVYSLCGFYIERVMKKERMNLETLTVLIMLSVLSVGATYLFTEQKMAYLGKWDANESQTFFNTFIVIPSATVFYMAKYWFTRHPVRDRAAAVWSLLSVGTFGTYLFERFWRDNTEFLYYAVVGALGPFFSSLLHIALACIVGIAATLLYKLVTGMIGYRRRQAQNMRLTRRQQTVQIHYTVPDEDISDLEEIEKMLGNSKKTERF